MVGSDYPYPLGERPVGEVVRKSEFLDDTARQLISRGECRTLPGSRLRPRLYLFRYGGR